MLCIPLYICFPLWCCSRRVIYCFRSSNDNETGRRTKLRFLEAKAHEMKLFMLFLFTERCLGMRSFFRRFSRFFFARRYAISQPSSWLRRDWYQLQRNVRECTLQHECGKCKYPETISDWSLRVCFSSLSSHEVFLKDSKPFHQLKR